MKDWTIMVYMAGDNNLSENMAFSLEDIRSVVGSTTNGSSLAGPQAMGSVDIPSETNGVFSAMRL